MDREALTRPQCECVGTHAEVTGLFAGLPLVAPGVVPVSEWRPDAIVAQVVDLYGGIARIPARRW